MVWVSDDPALTSPLVAPELVWLVSTAPRGRTLALCCSLPLDFMNCRPSKQALVTQVKSGSKRAESSLFVRRGVI